MQLLTSLAQDFLAFAIRLRFPHIKRVLVKRTWIFATCKQRRTADMLNIRALWCCLCFCRREALNEGSFRNLEQLVTDPMVTRNSIKACCNAGYAYWSKWCGTAWQMGRLWCPHRAHSGRFLWIAVVSSSRQDLPAVVGAHLLWIFRGHGVLFLIVLRHQTSQAHAGMTAVPSV